MRIQIFVATDFHRETPHRTLLNQINGIEFLRKPRYYHYMCIDHRHITLSKTYEYTRIVEDQTCSFRQA